MKVITSFFFLFYLQLSLFHDISLFAARPVTEIEITLASLYKNMDGAVDFSSKRKYNDSILTLWRDLLPHSESFWYPFDSLNYVGKVYATDSTLRIYSWNIPKPDGTHDYFCFVQLENPETKEAAFFELAHSKSTILNTEDTLVGTENWYGCLYYEVIPVIRDNRKYYTLLGFDLNNLLTNKKLIDVLYFESEVLNLGAPIFQVGRSLQKRVIFEYSSRAVMSLRYDQNRKMIVHDHLSPFQPRYQGQFHFYGPDFSFDGFVFESGRWIQVLDIDMSN